MRRPQHLSATSSREAITLAKQLLCEGRTQEEVAALTGLSQATVSRIRSGKSGADIPWPDGSLGAMPEKERKVEASWSADSARYFDLPSSFQERILELVNERRRECGLLPIPETSESYQRMLADPVFSADPEAVRLAQQEEDRRAGALMREFDGILAETLTERSCESVDSILDATSQDVSREVRRELMEPEYSVTSWGALQQLKSIYVSRAELQQDYLYLEAACASLAILLESPSNLNSEELHRQALRMRAILASHPTLVARIEAMWKTRLSKEDDLMAKSE